MASLVLRRHGTGLAFGDLNEEAENFVVAHLESLDAGTLLLAGLIFGEPVVAFRSQRAQLVQFRVVAGADDTAVLETDRRLVGNSTLNQRDQIGQGVELRGGLAQQGVGRLLQALAQCGYWQQRCRQCSYVARVAASRVDTRDEPFEIAYLRELFAQVVQDQTLAGQAFDRIKPRLDGGCLTKRSDHPRAQQTRAHWRLRVVEYTEQRCLLWLTTLGDQVEVDAGVFIERQESIGVTHMQGADVTDRVP